MFILHVNISYCLFAVDFFPQPAVMKQNFQLISRPPIYSGEGEILVGLFVRLVIVGLSSENHKAPDRVFSIKPLRKQTITSTSLDLLFLILKPAISRSRFIDTVGTMPYAGVVNSSSAGMNENENDRERRTGAEEKMFK